MSPLYGYITGESGIVVVMHSFYVVYCAYTYLRTLSCRSMLWLTCQMLLIDLTYANSCWFAAIPACVYIKSSLQLFLSVQYSLCEIMFVQLLKGL